MRPRWVLLNERDRAAFQANIAFLDGRFEEHTTIDWALKLKQNLISTNLPLLSGYVIL